MHRTNRDSIVHALVITPALALSFAASAHADVEFVRGDVDQSREVDITDAVSLLNHLFLGAARPGCLDAADTNDDGQLDLSDGVTLLNFLFLGSARPAVPYPTCGVDLTPDELDCETFVPCTTCEDDCESIACWVPNSDDTLICIFDLATCDEVAAAYHFVTRELAPPCDPEGDGCRLVWGRCDERLGGCYFAAGEGVEQYYLDVLLRRYEELDCFGPECDCPAPPEVVECLEGVCGF